MGVQVPWPWPSRHVLHTCALHRPRHVHAGIDWGMREDAVDEEEEESGDGGGKKGPRVTDKDEVHAKDMKLFERITTRRQKITNMNAEIERIRSKEMQQGGLSEGTRPTPVRGAHVWPDPARLRAAAPGGVRAIGADRPQHGAYHGSGEGDREPRGRDSRAVGPGAPPAGRGGASVRN